MYDGPIREGSRGGRDQFSWEAVKGDKDREFYLGHSVKALVGQWQKHKDPYWYTRSKDKWQTELADEVKAVKAKEEELMAEALGMKKPKSKSSNQLKMRLQKYEVDGMLKRREKDDGDREADEDVGMRGLGFRRTAMPMTTSTTHEVMKGVGIPDDNSGDTGLRPATKSNLKNKEEKKRKKEKQKKRRSISPTPHRGKRTTPSPDGRDRHTGRIDDAFRRSHERRHRDRRR